MQKKRKTSLWESKKGNFKKKLIRRFDFESDRKANQLQQKYNKFLDDLKEELNHPLRQQFVIQPRTMNEVSSILSKSGIMSPNQMSGIHPENFNMEEYFEGHLENFSNNIIQIKEIFKQAMNVDVNYEFRVSIDSTLINMKDLMDQITQYFLVFKEQFAKKLKEKREKAMLEHKDDENAEEILKQLEQELSADKYNEQLDNIHDQLDELNQINIERLGEIRDLNNKLEVLDEHLNSLMKDISDKRKKLLETDAKIIDVNSLIMSYENNLRQKTQLLKEKQKEYDELKQKSDTYNKTIGDMFFEIIELDKRTEALRQPVREGKSRQENVDREMKERQNNLDALDKEKEEIEREIKHLEQLSESLKDKMSSGKSDISEKQKKLNLGRIKNNKNKDELRQLIRQQVKKVDLILETAKAIESNGLFSHQGETEHF